MAGRIRTVKPELNQLHWFATLSDAAARTYYGLLGVVDDYGRCAADTSFIAGQIFWGRQRSATVIGRQLAELERAGIIRRYVTRGGEYLEVLGWFDKGGPLYQQINKPQGEKFPAPESDDDRPPAGHGDRPQTGTDPKGREWKGREREGEVPPARAVLPGSARPAPTPALALPSPPAPASEPRSSWHDRQRWWQAMLAADQRLRAAGIEPNAPPLPPSCAGENEKGMAACARQLVEAGYDAVTVDDKMHHIVLVAEAEAMRPDNRSRKWFKPSMIWDPVKANRAVDTTLLEAKRSRAQATQAGAAAPRRPDPGPAPITVSAADRAAAAAELARAMRPAFDPDNPDENGDDDAA